MEAEEDTNCYLEYLKDSEGPIEYLLENNEVGLFSVEPIFTEIAATDWPQDGFPLLLTNSLISEDSVKCENTEEATNTNLLISNDLAHPVELNPKKNSEDDELDNLSGNTMVNEKNETVLSENIMFTETVKNPDEEQLNYINLKPDKLQNPTKTIELLNTDGTEIPINNPTLSALSLSILNKQLLSANTKRPVKDLFSNVVAKKCKICSFLSEDLEQIKTHIKTKHADFVQMSNHNGASILLANAVKNRAQTIEPKKDFVIYVCSECRALCSNKLDLKNHMLQRHNFENKTAEGKTPREKKKCAYLGDVNVVLVKKQEKMLQKVKCSIKGCIASFPNEDLRRKHEKLHIGAAKNMFNCLDCTKKFQLWTVARTHFYKEHGLDFGMIVCPMCNLFKSYRTITMLRHMMVHSDDKPFLCSDCGKTFKQLAQLKNHEVSHKQPEDVPTWAKVRKCGKCDQFFANSKSLKLHVKTVHEQIKPFICNICGHKCSRKAMLELHIRQHTASKPHKCQYCQFRTGDHNSLRKHVLRHLGAKTYQCPHCSYSCIQSVSIKNHLIKEHRNQGGVYLCKYCSYTSINEMCFKAHEKKHELAKTALKCENETGLEHSKEELQTDEETQSCFWDDTVDNGGITIPAGLEITPAT